MSSQVSSVQYVPLGQYSSSPVLRSGAVVSLRVLSRSSDGSYVVSLAGKKMQVSSDVNLTPGSSVSAKVAVKNSHVSLVLQGESSSVQKNGMIHFSSDPHVLSNDAQIFLQSLSLPADFQSLKVVQFLQQMGLKINPSSIKKAFYKVRGTGGEREEGVAEAETSLLLEAKNLPSDKKDVASVQYSFHGERGNHQKKENPDDGKNKGQTEKKSAHSITPSDVKNYFDEVDKSAQSGKIGLLSLFNSLGFSRENSSSKKHWFNFPFEWKSMNLIGDIRLFYDDDLQNLKKMTINCENEISKKSISVYFNNKEITSAMFGLLPEPSPKEVSRYEKMLCAILKEHASASENVKVQCVSYGSIFGYGLEDSEIALVREEA